MSLTILTGTISHIDHSTAVSGRGNNGKMMVKTTHVWSFRLNNHPATYNAISTASFGEGDQVTVAGQEKNGTFVVESCRNETTGAVYERPATRYFVVSVGLIVLGLATIMVLIGIPILLLGGYFLMKALKFSKANKLIQSAPRPALASNAS